MVHFPALSFCSTPTFGWDIFPEQSHLPSYKTAFSHYLQDLDLGPDGVNTDSSIFNSLNKNRKHIIQKLHLCPFHCFPMRIIFLNVDNLSFFFFLMGKKLGEKNFKFSSRSNLMSPKNKIKKERQNTPLKN